MQKTRDERRFGDSMKNFVRYITCLLILVTFCCVFPLTVSADDDIVLNVYNWGEYISDGSEGSLNVNRSFEEFYKKEYGITVKVNYTTYEDNESLYAKLKNGATGYDVIFPSDYMIAKLIEGDMLAPLDFENIPNYEFIEDKFRNLKYDPEGKYSVPYTYGVIGIIYNKTMVDPEDVTGWDLMWNEKYSGMILQFNNYRDAFGTAMYKLGIDVNTDDPELWYRAYEELERQNPLVQSYVMDQIYNKLESEKAAIGAYYAGDYFTMYDVNENLAYYQPSNTNIFVDAMCIPKTSNNKLIAERYINFMLSAEPAIANAEYIYYASPNALVYNDPGYREYMGEEAMSILYPEDFDFSSVYNKCGYSSLSDETITYATNLWNHLKISSGLPMEIVITAFAIVLALSVLGISYFIKVQKRKKLYR
jgi:spermidine/putrescine transport system substrate-binding protein